LAEAAAQLPHALEAVIPRVIPIVGPTVEEGPINAVLTIQLMDGIEKVVLPRG